MLMKAKSLEVEPGVEFSFYYREGDKPLTLVFIHGLGDWKETHKPAAEYKALADYGLLIVDQIGYRDSSNPEGFNYAMKAQAEALLKLVNQLGVDEMVLVPHSMGGPVALELAEMTEDRVKGIIYAEGNVDFNDCFFSNWIITNHTYEEWVDEGFTRILERYRVNPDQAQYVVSFEKAGPVSTYRSSEDLVDVSKRDDIKDRLVELDIPVLAVFGEKNRGKFTSENKLGEAFPLVFIPDAAHSMMLDNPDEYYNEIANFVKSI
ncbi:alpha/beta fold hydrolase [Candidatus Bathyarchaeota archaeon]|nr:alpha/beta fold hydrolase [Candidatus Bathyarchaeota archaeon]